MNTDRYVDGDAIYSELMGKLRAKEAEFIQIENAANVRNVIDENARPIHLSINTPDVLGNI